jgi:hypothetical protein
MMKGPRLAAVFVVATATAFVLTLLVLGAQAPAAGEGGPFALVVGILLVPLVVVVATVLIRDVLGGRA